jgi:hypothetical protein
LNRPEERRLTYGKYTEVIRSSPAFAGTRLELRGSASAKGRKFQVIGSETGDYDVISPDGSLAQYDREGFINRIPKLREPEDDAPLDIATRIERWGRLLDVRDLADLLDTSTKQVYRLVHRRYIPSLRIAGSVKFDPLATANWLRSQAV